MPPLTTAATMPNPDIQKYPATQHVSTTIAPHAGAIGLAPADTPAIPVGTVSVQRTHPHRHQAVCTCGQLTTRPRIVHGFAVADALHHAAQTGCAPAQPLTISRLTTA